MDGWLPELRTGYDRATIRTIRLAFALSLLLHVGALWPWLPRQHVLSLEHPERGEASGPLIVQLVPPSRATSPPPAPPPTPQSQARPAPVKPAPPPRVAPRPAPSPPVVALNRPAPEAASPPAAPPKLDLRIPPVTGDFSSYLEARRLARGEAMPRMRPYEPPPEQTEDERRDRIIAANLGLNRTPTFGYDPKGGGGIFQIQRLGYDEAELIFFGWNKNIHRSARQLLEVERGDNSDIRVAVVRKVIAVIRESESGDFVWVSSRLGRDVTLSARPIDNAGLEAFLLRDFFFEPVRPL